MSFTERIQRLDGTSTQQAKISSILRQIDITDFLHQPVKGVCRGLFKKCLTFPSFTLGVDDIETVLPFRDQIRDQLRRVLQISIDDHHCIAFRLMQTCSHRDLLAEVTTQVQNCNTIIGISKLL